MKTSQKSNLRLYKPMLESYDLIVIEDIAMKEASVTWKSNFKHMLVEFYTSLFASRTQPSDRICSSKLFINITYL